MIDVREAGTYAMELRAYPREAGLPSGATSARLQVGGVEYVAFSDEKALCAVFSVDLAAGKTKLQTWLSNHHQRRVRGAYYVYVTRTPD